MKTRVFIFLLFFNFLAACSSNSSKQFNGSSDLTGSMSDSSSLEAYIDSLPYDSKQYSFISEIIQRGDTVFIDADYIQFLTGQAAIDAAVKAHDADTFKTADGVTHVDVPNDYYIVNEDDKIRRLKLSKNVKYDLLLDMHDEFRITNSLEGFMKVYKRSPYILSLYKNEIVKIEERFIP